MCSAVAAVGLVPAASASAVVPSGFIGLNLDGPALDPGSDVAAQFRSIARTGTKSVRWSVYWPEVQPYRSWAEVPAGQVGQFVDVGGTPTDLRRTDSVVEGAARADMSAMPVLMRSAPWVAENPFIPFSPPLDAAAFAGFAALLAARYGTQGSFWTTHPDVPRRPIREWQIWNEPAGTDGFGTLTLFWTSTREALPVYLELLHASALALRRADPEAHVVLGGLHGRSWISLEQIYAAGARDDFDSVAIHPYTRQPRNTVRLLRKIRAVMARHGDAGKPVDVTELSWPSSRGRVPDAIGIAVTPAAQALRLTRAYVLLARARQELRLRAVYWYTWMSRDFSPTDSFDYAGLVKFENIGGPVRKPAYKAFRRVARRLAR